MLSFQPARKRRNSDQKHRIGLAIAGGGPIGGIYELGALRALEEAVDGLNLTRMAVYVGVSSGSLIAGCLANRIDTGEMCRILLTEAGSDSEFQPEMFLKPAFAEYAGRVAKIPRVLWDTAWELVRNPLSRRFTEVLGRFGALLPTGLFDNTPVETFLRKLYTGHGRTNDFRELDAPLFVVAVELDSGLAVRFGAGALNKVPISRAIQASSALPGMYPPVEIGGKFYLDGALRRTLNASVALDEDIDLLIGINPLVPYDADRALARGKHIPDSLVTAGLPAVLSQTFRALLQSRMQVGLGGYARYEHTDKLLLEPDPDDGDMFFTNVFSFGSRRELCAHAYRTTLDDLRERRVEIDELLNPHGLSLNQAVLDDAERTLFTALERPPRRTHTTSKLHRALDDLALHLGVADPRIRARRRRRA